MQREASRRGFFISHQKVVLDVDLAGFVRGYTEITITPTSKNLSVINLHSRQCEINTISISGVPTEFQLSDPLTQINPTRPDPHCFPEIKRKLYSALSEADEGELSIAIPDDHLPSRTALNPSSQNSSNPGDVSSELPPLTIVIEYSIRHPKDGLQFVLPSDAYPYRVPHAYTTPASADSARCWVPCVDSIFERSTWDMELIVPKSLGGRHEDDMDLEDLESDSEDEEVPVIVVCSGELVEKVAHPHDSRKSIFVYSQSSPVSVQQMAWTIGPFHVFEIPIDTPPDPESSEATLPAPPSSQTPIHAFCLPGLEPSLRATTSFFRAAMNFFTNEYGSYPYGSHKLVFVDEMPDSRFDAATLSIISNDLLHGEDAIDEVYETRQSLSHALACQWVGVNITAKAWADTWLINGLGLYITALFLRRLFGNNEYRFRLRKDMDRVVDSDQGQMPPICRPTLHEPPDSAVLPFINLKAPIVLYILDRRLGKSGTSLGLSRVLPKIFLSAISGDLTNNMLSTHSFLRTCRKVSAVDVRTFAEQWIYGSGCPILSFRAAFNKKKMTVELICQQYCPAYKYHEASSVQLTLYRPVQTFEGPMTIRIHEADGTPYEHVIDIRNSHKKYEIPFNTKYKRVRRNTKRFLARKAAAMAAEAGDLDAAEAMEMIDSSFELKLWEDESKREWWMVSDWTEEDEANMNGSAYEWIRLDADFEWIARIQFDQPDFMWMSQLQRDRDVVAQLEALHALARQPSPIISSNLTKTVLVTQYHYRIRIEAVRLLCVCSHPDFKNVGLFHLFKLFSGYCHTPSSIVDPLRTMFVPKPNDFSDFSEYFVRKSIITSIAEYRDVEGKAALGIREFLIDQLRFNNNSQNLYSDALYISTIIAGLARTLHPSGAAQVSELSRTAWAPDLDDEDRKVIAMAVQEIERYKEMDRLNPSPHNVISIAILEWTSVMQLSSILPTDLRTFVAYSREGNYLPVRLAAFQGLLLNKWHTRKSLARYLFAVLAHDSSRAVRRFIARGVIASLGILEGVGDIKYTAKEDKSVLIEDDGTGQAVSKARRETVESAFKAIRREVGKKSGIREEWLATMLSAADYDVQWCLLKLADLIFRPEPEPKPTVSIKVQKPLPIVIDDDEPVTPLTARPPGPAPQPLLPTSQSSLPPISQSSVPPTFQPLALPPKPTSSVATPKPFVLPPSISTLPPKPEAATPISSPRITAPAVKIKKPRPPERALNAQSPVQAPAPPPVSLPYPAQTPSSAPVASPARLLEPQVSSHVPERRQLPVVKPPIVKPSMVSPLSGANESAPTTSVPRPKPKTISKTQKHQQTHPSGLNPQDHKHCQRIMRDLNLNPHSFFFRRPVDEARDGAPRYYETIKRPMDLSTMNSRLTNGQYATPDQLRDDFKQMVTNAKTYNAPGTHAFIEAETLNTVFDTNWDKYFKKRSSAFTNGHQSPHTSSPRPSSSNQPTQLIPEPPSAIPEAPQRAIPSPKLHTPSMTPHPASIKKEETSTPPPSSPVPSTLPRRIGIKLKAPKDPNSVPITAPPRPPSASNGSMARPAPKVKPPVSSILPSRKDDIDDVDDFIAQEIEQIEATKRNTPALSFKKKSKEKVGTTSSPRLATNGNGASSARSSPSPAGGQTPSRPANTMKKASANGSSLKRTASLASLKTKETESSPYDDSTPIDVNKCRQVWSVVTDPKRTPFVHIFMQPVDTVASNCPTYYDEIKHPMDFGTIKTKLESGQYLTMEAFEADVQLVFNNCRQFNPPGTDPVIIADNLNKLFAKEWARVNSKSLSPAHKRAMLSLISKLRAHDQYIWFLHPVDTKLFNDYNDKVPKKDMRDLGTIRRKLEEDKYPSLSAVAADFKLLATNAHKYNGSHDAVALLASQMQREVEDVIMQLKKSGKGASSSGTSNGEPSSKKSRLG